MANSGIETEGYKQATLYNESMRSIDQINQRVIQAQYQKQSLQQSVQSKKGRIETVEDEMIDYNLERDNLAREILKKREMGNVLDNEMERLKIPNPYKVVPMVSGGDLRLEMDIKEDSDDEALMVRKKSEMLMARKKRNRASKNVR